VNPWLIGVPAIAAAAAGGLAAYGGIHPRAQLFGPTICRTNSPRKLAITFDDGPNPAITRNLLDCWIAIRRRLLFSDRAVHSRMPGASWRNFRARPCHRKSYGVTPEFILDAASGNTRRVALDVFRNQELAGRSAGLVSAAIWLAKSVAGGGGAELNMRVVMWTLLPGDWRAPSSEWLIQRMEAIAVRAQRALKRGSGTGEILCLHDGGHREQEADRTRTLAALEHWLPRWRDLGLEFVTINNAVNGPHNKKWTREPLHCRRKRRARSSWCALAAAGEFEAPVRWKVCRKRKELPRAWAKKTAENLPKPLRTWCVWTILVGLLQMPETI